MRSTVCGYASFPRVCRLRSWLRKLFTNPWLRKLKIQPDPGDQGQEGARRGEGGPRLHHFQTLDDTWLPPMRLIQMALKMGLLTLWRWSQLELL